MRLELGRLEVRDAAEPGGPRRIGGYAVVWGQVAERTAEYGPEAFAPGSFRDAIRALGKRPIPYLDRHDGEVIAVLRAQEDAHGLALDGELFDSPAADSWARRSAAGVDGASIEFLPDPAGVRTTRDGIAVHRRVARLIAVAASYKPAHLGAAISLRDMEIDDMDAIATVEIPEPVPEPEPEPEPRGVTAAQVEGIVRREVGEVRRSVAELGGTVRSDPWAMLRDVDNLGELVKRVVVDRPTDTELRAVMVRALADQLTTANPGVMTPGVISDIKGIVTRARTAIEAFGTRGLDGSGMSVDWPVSATALSTIVGEQATQKTEIVSVAVPITKGTAAIKTYAGGSDVSYQLIRRSSPSYLDALERIYLAAYAAVTDSAFVAAIAATAGIGAEVINWTTANAAAMHGAALSASVKIKDATGEPAAFLLASATAFVAIGKALNPAPVYNAPGTANAGTLSLTLSGLPVLYHPGVAAGLGIFGNQAAAAWHEDGPYFATEEDVAKLGRNVAIWGMGAPSVYIPAGIVKTSNT